MTKEQLELIGAALLECIDLVLYCHDKDITVNHVVVEKLRQIAGQARSVLPPLPAVNAG